MATTGRTSPSTGTTNLQSLNQEIEGLYLNLYEMVSKIQYQSILSFCRIEAERQGAPEQLHNMVAAYAYIASNGLDEHTLRYASMIIDPEDNDGDYRRNEVTFSNQLGPAAKSIDVRGLMQRWFLAVEENPAPLPSGFAVHFHDELMHIHPFRDGNGRLGKIVYNHLAGTLLQPKFPDGKYL